MNINIDWASKDAARDYCNELMAMFCNKSPEWFGALQMTAVSLGRAYIHGQFERDALVEFITHYKVLTNPQLCHYLSCLEKYNEVPSSWYV